MNCFRAQQILSISILVILFSVSSRGRAFGQLSFDHLSVNNGLSQSTVLSIAKDSRGYMWFGTRDGLNRYDGKNVKTYHAKADNPASISSDDYIFALAEDKLQNLWIGTQNGLNRYIPEKDAFERFFFNSKNAYSISNNTINSIQADREGRMWFGTDMGLNMLENPASLKFKKIFKAQGLAGNAVYAILEDSKGNIWVGTTTGLSQISINNGKFHIRSFYHQALNPNSLSGNSIRAITEDEKGQIWIGTEFDGLNLFLPETQSFKKVMYDADQLKSKSNNFIRKILPDGKGSLWIGCALHIWF